MPHTLESKSFKLRSAAKQVERLQQAVPSIKSRMGDAAKLATLLDHRSQQGYDGHAAIINPHQWGEYTIAGAIEAWVKFSKLHISTPEKNAFALTPGRFPGNSFTLDPRTSDAYATISKQQAGPVLIIPIRFDHVSTPLRENEFYLDTVACVSLFLTHTREFDKEPLVKRFELVCTGQRYSRPEPGSPVLVPTVAFDNHLLKFRLRDPAICEHRIHVVGLLPKV